MADSVRIRREILEQMLDHARRESHIECCGLLAGRDGVITAIFPATNALASPTRYEIAPRELFDLFRQIRAAGLEHLGQYHSHLASDNLPSPTDVEQAGYPDQPYFIITPLEDAPRAIRAFLIGRSAVREVEITVTKSIDPDILPNN